MRIPTTDEVVAVRVLDPVLLLAGKIRNAVDIEQDRVEKPRQDLKHVAMLVLCAPLFLEDLRGQTPGRREQMGVCGEYITMLAALKNTYSGRLFEAQHAGVIHWKELVPPRIQELAFEAGVKASLRQLTGVGQSRGIGI